MTSSRAASLGRRLCCAAGLVAATAAGAHAQRADSARTAASVRVLPADSLQPPLSPRRAFLYSFLAPGYAQSVLGRHNAAVLLMLVEGVTISMIRESAAEVREARRTADDTLVASWVDANGKLGRTVVGPPRFTATHVRSRRRHEEDWIALLIANHLFAGADAYVAANLWDLPTQLSLRAGPGSATLVASVRW